MAGVLVDVLIERLATLALDKVERELKLVVGVKQEINNLTEKLKAIRAVLEDAEQRQVMEASVKLWLDKLNDVSFDMDDVLDEWITRVLKYQLEKQEKQQKKVCFPFPSSCFRFGQVNYQLFLRREIAKKIEELNERLDLIDKNKQSFNFQQNTPRAVPELLQRPKTTSLPNASTFGRDSEKNLIISKLLSENSEESEVPLIVLVVGLGGMGKTYLANLVYNEIKTHFDKSIWVCVSDPFDEIKIAQAIIEELDKDNSSKSSNVLQTLTKCIFDLIKGKKFLLVLDDVWYPKSSQWEEFIKPFRNGVAGSRVLVTTRNEDVATLMNATTELVPLKGLGEAFCLSLFYHSACMVESSVSKEFHDIGLEIVKRCNGLPLAAKTLGSLMCNKKNNIREWRDVIKSKTWELKEVQQDVFRPLLLSYHDLPLATKQCLLYCVLFPKDHVYDKNNLIELWMSQDYLNVNRSKEMMIVGQNYFDELVMRSFLQDIEVDERNGNIRCKIHDIVHDFLQYLTENEYLILDLKMDDNEGKKVPNDQLRHFTLMNATETDSSVYFHLKCKNLRTLVLIDSNSISLDATVEMIVQLKCLRTITLVRPWYNDLKEIPETIGGLIHLRYLDLSYNEELKELPSAMGSLYNLQTLRLDKCRSLTRIDVRRLINLRHLYVQGCSSLRLIKGIEKLTHMQRLDWFYVRDGGDEGGNKLEHLTDLNQLQGSLVIYIDSFPSTAENNAAIMKNKAYILELYLSFSGSEDRQIMNRLEPHPSLEYLSILGYEGGTFSDWLSSLHSLRVLSLTFCGSCEILPSLGKLASLESLEILGLFTVSKVGVEFLGIEQGQISSSSSFFVSFPKLKQLTIRGMESWEEWEGVEEGNSENITIMPFLDQLTIISCKSLKALPDFLWKTPLQKLNISYSPILQNLYGQENGEERTKISYIPSIQMQNTGYM